MAIRKRNLDVEKLAEFVDDMKDVLKNVFDPLFQRELDNHLEYDAYSKEPKKHDNRRSRKKYRFPFIYVLLASVYFRV